MKTKYKMKQKEGGKGINQIEKNYKKGNKYEEMKKIEERSQI